MATTVDRTQRFEQTFDIVCGSIGRGVAGRSASIVLDCPPSHEELAHWRARAAAFNVDARLDAGGVIVVERRRLPDSVRDDAPRRVRSPRERLCTWWADGRRGLVSAPAPMPLPEGSAS